MSDEIALDTSVAVRLLNGDVRITERVLTLPEIILPTIQANIPRNLTIRMWRIDRSTIA